MADDTFANLLTECFVPHLWHRQETTRWPNPSRSRCSFARLQSNTETRPAEADPGHERWRWCPPGGATRRLNMWTDPFRSSRCRSGKVVDELGRDAVRSVCRRWIRTLRWCDRRSCRREWERIKHFFKSYDWATLTIWAFFEVCGEDFRPKYKWVKYLSFLGHFLIVIGDLLLKPAGHHVSSFNKATYQFLLIFALANIMQVPILNI